MSSQTIAKILFLAAGLTGVALADSPASDAAAPAKAKISRAAAERTALAQVPHGKVQSAELEREHGRLIWSFDIALADSRDIKEVQVDANSGAVVAVETETPEQQADEVAADAGETSPQP
jgi:uncharacterized membrane protein YkoI